MSRALAALVLIAGIADSHFASASVASKTLVTVVNGEQVTRFELRGRKLKLSSSNQQREVELTKKDMREVKETLGLIASMNSHEKRFCGRTYLELHVGPDGSTDSKGGRKTFCLNSKTSSAKASNELARLLALIVKIR